MRWTSSDTAGFLIAAAIFMVPPLAFAHLVSGLRKPNDPPETYEWHLVVVVISLIAAGFSSTAVCRFGGSADGRWAIHGLVATLVFIAFSVSYCFWPR